MSKYQANLLGRKLEGQRQMIKYSEIVKFETKIISAGVQLPDNNIFACTIGWPTIQQNTG